MPDVSSVRQVQMKRAMQATLQELLDHFRPERALVLYADEGCDLTVRAAHGVDPESVWTTAPLSLSIFDRVYRSGESMLCGDVRTAPDLQDITSLLLSGVRTLMCVPVRKEEQIRGILHVDVRMRETQFTERDLATLENFSRDLERRLNALERVPAPAQPPGRQVRLSRAPLNLRPASRVLFLRCLTTMLAAGVTLTRALELLGRSGDDGASRNVATRLGALVEQGQPLSEAMREAAPAFGAYHVQLVAVGERTGTLVEVLSQLAQNEEKTHALQARVRATLTYPALLFVLSTGMLLVLPPLMLRGQLDFLRSLGVTPPYLLQVAQSVAVFVERPAGALSLLLACALLGTQLRRLFRGSRRLWSVGLRIPRLDSALRLFTTARFARSLALQLNVGVSAREALTSSARVTGNPIFQEEVWEAKDALESGEDLSTSLACVTQFPSGFLPVLRSGEESGRLPTLLRWLADAYEFELELALQSVCSALEPLMLMVMGMVAAAVCLGTMLPMVKVVENL